MTMTPLLALKMEDITRDKAGRRPLGAESGSRLAASKELGTSEPQLRRIPPTTWTSWEVDCSLNPPDKSPGGPTC